MSLCPPVVFLKCLVNKSVYNVKFLIKTKRRHGGLRLLAALVSGLESVVLKDEVFRKCESFKDVDSSHKFCVNFPIKTKQAPSASSPSSHAVNTGTNQIVYARSPHSVPSHSTRFTKGK